MNRVITQRAIYGLGVTAVAVLSAVLLVTGPKFPPVLGLALLLLLGLVLSLALPLVASAARAVVSRPMLAVAAVAATLIFGRFVLPVGVHAAEFLALIAALVVFTARLTGHGRRIGWSPMLAAMTVLVATALVATWTSLDPRPSLRQDLVHLTGLALAAAVVAAAVYRSDLVLLAVAFCLGGAVLCSTAFPSTSTLQTDYSGALVENRPVGAFAQPNELGMASEMILCFSLGMAVLGWRQRRTGLTALCGTTAALALSSLALSLSRGAWLGALVGMIFLAVLLREARRPLLGLLAVACTAAVALTIPPAVAQTGASSSPIIVQRFLTIFTGRQNPYDVRPWARAEAVRQVSDRPLLGSGPAAYPLIANQGPVTSPNARTTTHAHELFLTVGAEEGIVGAAALVGTIGVGTREALRTRGARPTRQAQAIRDERSKRGDGRTPHGASSTNLTARAISASSAAALAAVIGQGVIDYPLRHQVLQMMIWLCVGLLAACAPYRPLAGHGAKRQSAPVEHTEAVAMRHESAKPGEHTSPASAATKRLSGLPGRVLRRGGRALGRFRSVLRRATRSGLLPGLLAGLFVLITGLAVISALPVRYAATSTVSFSPRVAALISSDTLQLTAKKYAVQAASPALMKETARVTGIPISHFRSKVTSSVPLQTANLDITATLPDRTEAAVVSRNAANIVVYNAGRTERMVNPQVTYAADPSLARATPQPMPLRIAVAAAAVLIGGWVGFTVHHFSVRAARRGS